MSERAPSSAEQSKQKCCQNPWLICLIISIFGMIVPPLIGVSGTVFGMVREFDELSRNGKGDTEALASGISQSLITTAIGLVISFIFLILFFISLVKVLSNKKRKQ